MLKRRLTLIIKVDNPLRATRDACARQRAYRMGFQYFAVRRKAAKN